MGVFARLLGRSKTAPEVSDAAARTGLEPDGAEAEPAGRALAAWTGGADPEGADAEGADAEGADATGAGAVVAEARDGWEADAVAATGVVTAADAGDAAGDRREAVTARADTGRDGGSEGGIPRQQSAGQVADSAAGEGARR
ncbi:hypothetical protein ACH4NF_15105 [Streptomyces sp. NPDC017248]|uniref:hypothetical protein n=1 Tax=unclassified Streptomyces TaxID=2593676 RepID=UPI0037A571FD